MYLRLRILFVGLLVAVTVRPALANNDGFVVWDHNIASAVSASLRDEDRCGASPYALYGARLPQAAQPEFRSANSLLYVPG